MFTKYKYDNSKIYVHIWGNCFGPNRLLTREINKHSDISTTAYKYSWPNYDLKLLCHTFMYIKWDHGENVRTSINNFLRYRMYCKFCFNNDIIYIYRVCINSSSAEIVYLNINKVKINAFLIKAFKILTVPRFLCKTHV